MRYNYSLDHCLLRNRPLLKTGAFFPWPLSQIFCKYHFCYSHKTWDTCLAWSDKELRKMSFSGMNFLLWKIQKDHVTCRVSDEKIMLSTVQTSVESHLVHSISLLCHKKSLTVKRVTADISLMWSVLRDLELMCLNLSQHDLWVCSTPILRYTWFKNKSSIVTVSVSLVDFSVADCGLSRKGNHWTTHDYFSANLGFIHLCTYDLNNLRFRACQQKRFWYEFCVILCPNTYTNYTIMITLDLDNF